MAHPEYVHEWSDRFAMLGDPSRLSLLLLMHRRGPIAVNDLSQATGLKPTTVSQALRVLRFQHIVAMVPEGRSHLYRVIDESTAALLDHLPDHHLPDHPATVENGR
ncbi:ArsR/SmtB family transcription factor [Pseudonocardia sp. HH130629-09]|uniref:ArsR/SmtB family transcription factor n=1 Tax=Pseudonocardia sp. HH130629-09 TaxID=1641402 RepID=UPI00076151DF|nr:metalloregulator ArsR/SmtB family transcription factor [Pseudonocardia sp. HH130629-09]